MNMGFIYHLILPAICLAGILPVALTITYHWPPSTADIIIAVLNLAAWSLVATFFLIRKQIRSRIEPVLHQIGVHNDRAGTDQLLFNLIDEVERKNASLSLQPLETRIVSREELSRSLERIVALAYKLLNARSAELALFDRDSGMYHSSFVLGKPFRVDAQAMLSGAAEQEEEGETSPDVVIQPIAFAGSILGTLRIGLRKGTIPTPSDRQILSLLALQSGVAILNAEYTDELVKMRESSEESIRAKTGFLANLSHEIRGPLGIILNAVELVLDDLCGPTTDDQRETLDLVKRHGDHLLELINDVLDYAKVESGKITPDKSDILIDEILKDVTGVARSQAENKSHKLIYTPCREALAIHVDRRHMRQILINLLTNAIKYTPEGGSIEISAERTPANRIEIHVRDNGIGISAADRKKVFAAFERIENNYTIQQQGTGLGMPLAQRLVEVNSGSIDFESTPGEGSHFWVSFPAVAYDPMMEEKQSEEKNDAEGQGDTLLIVDSGEPDQDMIAKYLSHIGFRVVRASNRADLLGILRTEGVHAAVLDNTIVDRPDDDIIESIRNSSSSTLPLILLSSRAFIFDVEQYLRAGIDRCLSKPVPLKLIGQVCRELIDRQRSHNVPDKKEPRSRKKTYGQSPKQKEIKRDDFIH